MSIFDKDAERSELICKFADQCFDSFKVNNMIHNRDWTEDDATAAREYARGMSTAELRTECS